MRERMKKIGVVLVISIVSIVAVGGCSSPSAESTKESAEFTQADTEPAEVQDTSGTLSAEKPINSGESTEESGAGIGEFTMQSVDGTEYTEKMFQDYELTMVNIFTTWCTPCINEIPDLEKLRNEMADKGVNVVGIVLDAAAGFGDTDGEAVEKAKLLAERAEVTYPFLIPDAGLLNGRLAGVQAVPETFFVDKQGNIVGETYSGSHSLEEWKEIVEQTLGGIEGAGE
ncbi:TlpA disulfide reductase family protein [Lachnospiraceae bacterium 46-15]